MPIARMATPTSVPQTGTPVMSEGGSVTEGIGQSRVPGNLEGAPIDDAIQVTDEEALEQVFDLTLPMSESAEGYRAMDERRAIKTLLRV